VRGNSLFKKIDRWIGIPLVVFFGALNRVWLWFFRSPPKILKAGDRVLVVKLSALGDTLLLLPIFKALKQQVGPAGRVLMIATSVNQAAVENVPFVDEVLILDFHQAFKNPLTLLKFLARLRAFKPAVALDFDQWLRISPLLCFLSGAPRRLGFRTARQYRHALYHETVPNQKGEHESEQFAGIARLAGVQRESIEPYNGFLEREGLFKGSSPDKPAGNKKKRVHFHPGCGSYGRLRAWPEEYYAKLAKGLAKALDVQIQVTGMGSYEENLVRQVIEQSGTDIQNLSGRLEINELADLLRKADLVVCGNTGVMHLATGLGRPLVVMNGPADPVKWGPSFPEPDSGGKNRTGEVRVLSANLLCSPCTTLGFEYGCPFRSCMESIEVETVLKECLSLLKAP
jgi:ADP-heptose:LPS heptosyltransferase